MTTALLTCLYLAPVLIVFAAMAWVADRLEAKTKNRRIKS